MSCIERSWICARRAYHASGGAVPDYLHLGPNVLQLLLLEAIAWRNSYHGRHLGKTNSLEDAESLSLSWINNLRFTKITWAGPGSCLATSKMQFIVNSHSLSVERILNGWIIACRRIGNPASCQYCHHTWRLRPESLLTTSYCCFRVRWRSWPGLRSCHTCMANWETAQMRYSANLLVTVVLAHVCMHRCTV